MEEERGALPALGDNAIGGQLGEALVEVAVLERGHLYTRLQGLDFGVDGTIEFVTGAAQASGRLVGVQVKRGLSVMRTTRRGRTLYFNEQHANYWLGHTMPVVVVHVEPGTNRMRWRHANADTIRKTGNGYAIDLPEDSDLISSLAEVSSLAAVGGAGGAVATAVEQVLAVPYDPERGVTTAPEELGLAAMAFSRAALRGESCRVEIEINGEAELIASIDVIRDLADPTPAQRRDATIRLDMLHDMRARAIRLKRALTLLLTESMIAEAFGYRDDWLGKAIRHAAPGTAEDRRDHRELKGLEAWPDHRTEQPVVKFDVDLPHMDEFYDRSPLNRDMLHAGNVGGVVVGDLPPEVVATRFLPRLANRLLLYADANGISERDALARIGVQPNLWLVAVA